MSTGISFTDQVRQELSRVAIPDEASRRAELGAILRLAGEIHRRGRDADTVTIIEVASTAGAVARRVFSLLRLPDGIQPQLWVRAPGGVRVASSYGVSVPLEAVGQDAGVLVDGRLEQGMPAMCTDQPEAAARGALLAAARLSSPSRPAHLEIAVSGPRVGEELAELLRGLTGKGTVTSEDPPRVVLKSSPAIQALLEATGATTAADTWGERRQRRRLRNEATRLANADAANLRRSATVAAEQVDLVQRVVDRLGWDAIPEDLRSLALVRLANPSSSLAELGELCDPPISKSAVHRRMARLRDLGEGDGFD